MEPHYGLPMKYMLLIYIDDALVQALPPGELDAMMRKCLQHTDQLSSDGVLLLSERLDEANTARSLRARNGRSTVLDGPFAETKEVLGGFNLIEAANIEEALRIAAEFPWSKLGSIEVRPVRDLMDVRREVGA